MVKNADGVELVGVPFDVREVAKDADKTVRWDIRIVCCRVGEDNAIGVRVSYPRGMLREVDPTMGADGMALDEVVAAMDDEQLGEFSEVTNEMGCGIEALLMGYQDLRRLIEQATGKRKSGPGEGA